jgi:hypothetical protein
MTPRLVSLASIMRFFSSSMSAILLKLGSLLIKGFLFGLLVLLSLRLVADKRQCQT